MVGWLLKEAPKGALMENEAAKLLNDLGFKLVDASLRISSRSFVYRVMDPCIRTSRWFVYRGMEPCKIGPKLACRRAY